MITNESKPDPGLPAEECQEGRARAPEGRRPRADLETATLPDSSRVASSRGRPESPEGDNTQAIPPGWDTQAIPPQGDNTQAIPPDPQDMSAGDTVTQLLAPVTIGSYRILSLLGEGGMGSVYLAEQSAPVKRKVAVKLIRASFATPGAIALFNAERQAMARLTHPAVAQIFEAGTTRDGCPYFVMEHVPGESLTSFCDRMRLSVAQRLELFIKICHGVEHAHRKGIMHRDLKPSNVMVAEVDGRPAPKIIDFGIAKALDSPLTDETMLTRYGLGTPGYMSPETYQGSDVDTRTDIYALGVMLFELVTGTLPFEIHGVNLSVVIRNVITEPAPRPSQHFRSLDQPKQDRLANRRRSDCRQLAARIDGDLDWITAKALEQEPDRRYGSATELAADVRRHLEFEPVTARAPSVRYRMGRFVRRNRAIVAAASLAVIALILGTIGTTLGMMRARREAERANQETENTRQALLDAEEVTDFLIQLFEISDPREAGGESTTARQLLDRGAGRIEESLSDQPLRQARVMHAIGVIYDQLQAHQEARRLVNGALELRRQELPPDHRDVADSLHRLAVIDRQLAEYIAAEKAARRSLEIRQKAHGPDHPRVGEALRELAVTLYLTGRYDQAEPLVRRALEIARTNLAADHPAVTDSLETLGNLLKGQGRCAEAISPLSQVLAIREGTLGSADPRLAYALNNLASCYAEERRHEEALPLFERALAIQENTLGPQATPVAVGRTNLGILYRDLGRSEVAESALVRARDDLASGLGPEHPLVANAAAELGLLLGQQGRLPEAEAQLRRAVAIWIENPGPEHPWTAWGHWGLANVLRDHGRLDEAESHYRSSLEIRRKTLPAGHPELHRTLTDYARLLRATGREAEAAEMEAEASAKTVAIENSY